MEVNKSEWRTKAVEKIDKYLHRGGYLKGDEPQLLEGTRLLNTIGVPLNLPVTNPDDWNDNELQLASNSTLVYFVGDARKAIDVIADQIKYCCNGDEKNYITVLPIILYYEGKLYEVPLFRVQRHKNTKKFYVDNIGRFYDSCSDWFNNNKLPPCEMAYPHNLTLKLKPGYDYSHVITGETPSYRTVSIAAQNVDTVAAIAGIGSSALLLFVTGGIAAPLVATGIATALWGTGRTGYELIDRANHGENINPFSNSKSRALWLGITGNIVSFGAMGASMRLTSLAIRGRNISNSFKLFVNVINGSNVAISGYAMIDTTIYLAENYEKLSSVEVLMHVASVAFWTKGLFTYKSAGTLKKNAQEYAFKIVCSDLNPEETRQLSAFRNQFNDDSQLLREFHIASKKGIFTQSFFQIVCDSATIHGNVQFDGTGNLVFPGGQKYPLLLLARIPQNVRKHFFDVIINLRTDQVELLESFRHRIGNDVNLISGIHKVAGYYRLTEREATARILSFWKKFNEANRNMPTVPNISFEDGSLILGRSPPLQINQLHGMSNTMVRFVGEHLVRMNESTSRQWTTSIPVLMQLEGDGMFSNCQVTQIVSTGRAVVLLNKNLQISIYKLKEMETNDCRNMLTMIGQLPHNVNSTNIPEVTKLLIKKYRFQLECHRKETLKWITTHVLPRLSLKLENFEKDRLTTFKSTITTFKAIPYIRNLINFVSDMGPKNVSEMVSYGEYVIICVEAEKRDLEGELRNGRLQLPGNTNKAAFLRKKASEIVFRNTDAMRRKWNTTLNLVRANSMVGPASLGSGLSDDALVTAIRSARIGFGSPASAAYHVLKHPTDPPSAYVDRANETIRSATRWQVTLAQDGDARLLRFEGPQGSAILLERNGSVLLCTFSPKSARP